MQHLEEYTLAWQSYSDHLKEALKEMMTSSGFADVTLVTDDKQQIRAHRNILSACSPVFKNILQFDSSNNNPIIYLRGIQYSEMESIMQFIYLGEARFYKERISEFLMVSKNLEIKGLSTDMEMNYQTSSNKENSEEENDLTEDHVDDDPSQTLNENVANGEHQAHKATKPITEYNETIKRDSGADRDKNLCIQCDKQFTTQGNLKAHIKNKHEGLKYACDHCVYQATHPSHLKIHIQSVHEGVKYACNQCNYQATQQSNLTRHNMKTHILNKHIGTK